MRKELYLRHTAKDAYATVRDCRFCTQICVHSKKRRQLKLFFPDRLLEYVGLDKLGPLLNTKQSNWFVVFMTD